MTLFSKDAMELQAMRSAWKEKCDLVESLRQQLARCIDTCATRENEIIEAEQQLAAALAACKLKDEIIEEVLPFVGTGYARLREALAIQPDDSALKAWIGEPVAWLHENRPEADVITDAVKNVWTGVVVGKDSVYSIPLYAPKGLK